MSSDHENLDSEATDDLSGVPFDFIDAGEDGVEAEKAGSVQPKSDITARARLEALREQRALRKAIYDDLYYDEDLGDD